MDIPINIYSKTQLASIYNSDSPKKWDARVLGLQIHSDKSLMYELKKAGYRKMQKKLTKEQVSILFKHYPPPKINAEISKILGISNPNLKIIENIMNKDFDRLKELSDIDDNTLKIIGIIKNENPDVNYYNIENSEFILTRQSDFSFIMQELPNFKVIKRINTSRDLIITLIKIRNGKY